MFCNSVHIQNFRRFDNFRMEGMGQVCLIAGKNNVGKTNLLEALFLLAEAMTGEISVHIDSFRELPNFDPDEKSVWQWQWHNGKTENPIFIEAVLGNVQRQIRATLEPPIRIKPQSDGVAMVNSGPYWKCEYSEGPYPISFMRTFIVPNPKGGSQLISAFEEGADRLHLQSATFFPSHNRNFAEEAQRFGALVRHKEEQRIIRAMTIIEPRLVDLRANTYANISVVYASLKEFPELIPITHLGDGIGQLFRYLVGIATFKGGMILIDEIENGFHYTMLTNVWRALYTAAKENDVQLIATTHSRECIEAACDAFQDDTSLAVSYHRLILTDNGIKAITSDRGGLDAAIAVEAEVR